MPNHLIIDPGTAHLHLHLHQTDKIKTLFTPTKSGDVVTATGNRGQTSLFPISKSKKKKNTLTTSERGEAESRSNTKGKTYVNKNLLEFHLHNAVKRAKGSPVAASATFPGQCTPCIPGKLRVSSMSRWGRSDIKNQLSNIKKTTTATTTHTHVCFLRKNKCAGLGRRKKSERGWGHTRGAYH